MEQLLVGGERPEEKGSRQGAAKAFRRSNGVHQGGQVYKMGHRLRIGCLWLRLDLNVILAVVQHGGTTDSVKRHVLLACFLAHSFYAEMDLWTSPQNGVEMPEDAERIFLFNNDKSPWENHGTRPFGRHLRAHKVKVTGNNHHGLIKGNSRLTNCLPSRIK
ncbi:hypothetical protein QYF61_020887 [Mycteria americana]|uniref:Uncharacterized protein n=1 Tax=Mycteria americana TaxID=33587 RepID=A0AAN7PJV4_MYCAM|nr:hypothetical protein QYF61_020887 [Mycteria americana]